MKTVRNKTHRPLRVPLPQGKVLHLGPGKTGQIAAQAVDGTGVQRLVAAGELEIVGDGGGPAKGAARGGRGHADTHGHHPDLSTPKRGDR